MFANEAPEVTPEDRSSPRLVEAIRNINTDENTVERLAKLTSSRAWDDERREPQQSPDPSKALRR